MATANQPAPRDYAAEMNQMAGFAQQLAAAQAAQALSTNQGYIDQALAATDKIGGKLDNAYTKQGLAHLNSAAGQLVPMQSLASQMTGLSTEALGRTGQTEIENQLQSQALSDLALGRSLSPEQERAAQQSARAGYAARGMATGAGSAAAEILNRDAYAQNRLDSRRAFAGTVDQANNQAVNSRLATAGSLLGQSFGAQQNVAQQGQSLAQGYVALDPYQRALGSNIPIASQGASASLANSAYGASMAYAGDLYNTNYNAQWSNYLNTANNKAALQQSNNTIAASNSQAKATNNTTAATTAATAGSAALTAAAACWVAREAFGAGNPEWLVFRSWLLRRAPAGLLRWYSGNGRAAAAWLRGHAWAKPAVRGAMRLAYRSGISGCVDFIARVEKWLTRLAHNEEIGGSNPSPAIKNCEAGCLAVHAGSVRSLGRLAMRVRERTHLACSVRHLAAQSSF